jgi:two-component system, LytTR family, response regulator
MKKTKTRLIIIDDEKATRTICKIYLAEREDILIVGECESVDEGEYLINTTQPDLVLLDINLIGGTGFDLLKRFTNPTFKIIFITISSDYALNAIKAGAIDYIIKPIAEDELLTALDKVILGTKNTQSVQVETANDYINGKSERVVVKTMEALHILNFEDLIYCQSDKGYTTFFLKDGSTILASRPIKDYESFLPQRIFIRVHQSYLVNIHFISQIKKDLMLVLKNKIEIPISVRKRDEVLKMFT